MENRIGRPAMEKRIVITKKRRGMQAISNLILVGVLLAAGAVLKLFLSSYFTVMKPNFIIAMYCLSALLIKPKLAEAIGIGLLAGIVSQFFPGTPYINLISEPVGMIAMFFLMKIPMKIKKLNLSPIVCTVLSTLASGFSYVLVMYGLFYSGADIIPTPLAAFIAIIFGTAGINAVIVQVLYLPLKAALKKS